MDGKSGIWKAATINMSVWQVMREQCGVMKKVLHSAFCNTIPTSQKRVGICADCIRTWKIIE